MLRWIGLVVQRGEVVFHLCPGERDARAKCPGESSASHRELPTLLRGVDVRPAPGCPVVRIGHQGRSALGIRACDHAQQLARSGP